MRHMLGRMADPNQTTPDALGKLPGEALESGFRFRPAGSIPQGSLSADARRRVIDKMDSVDEARLRAAKDGHAAYIG